MTAPQVGAQSLGPLTLENENIPTELTERNRTRAAWIGELWILFLSGSQSVVLEAAVAPEFVRNAICITISLGERGGTVAPKHWHE